MLIWLDGQFVQREEAKISLFDAGLQHAVGLFETMSASQGRVFRVAEHVQRLADSAKQLLLTESLRKDRLVEAINRTVEKNDLTDGRVRLTVTGGDLSLLQSQGEGKVDPSIFIVAQPATVYPDSFFEKGVTVTIADGRVNPLHPMAGHKTLDYWPRIHALQSAATKQAGESLWFSVSNHLASGSVSNVFLVRDGSLMTPIARGEEQEGAIPAGVLPGITRTAVIEIAEAGGIQVLRKMLDINDLLAADEVFLTNASWLVLPVVRVEEEEIGDGSVGPVTTNTRERLLELVADETVSGSGSS